MAAHRAVGFAATIRDELGVDVAELNLGGGIGIRYTDADHPLDIADDGTGAGRNRGAGVRASGLAMPRLAFEPGRAIIGPTMLTCYTVGTVKRRTLEGGGVRHYVSVDGGMSDNIRTALYDADYTITLANRVSQAPAAAARVVGKHCESGDVVVRDCWLPDDVGVGICWPWRPPAPTTARWRATTTWSPGRRSSP